MFFLDGISHQEEAANVHPRAEELDLSTTASCRYVDKQQPRRRAKSRQLASVSGCIERTPMPSFLEILHRGNT
jgi:hypothetical protein